MLEMSNNSIVALNLLLKLILARDNHVSNTNRIGFEPFSPFTREKRNVRSGTVFEVHAFVTGFKLPFTTARFRRISVNEQPKRILFHG